MDFYVFCFFFIEELLGAFCRGKLGSLEISPQWGNDEQMAGVVSMELLHNRDWTFQILLMLEMTPAQPRGRLHLPDGAHQPAGAPHCAVG